MTKPISIHCCMKSVSVRLRASRWARRPERPAALAGLTDVRSVHRPDRAKKRSSRRRHPCAEGQADHLPAHGRLAAAPLFDYKPLLNRRHGRTAPKEVYTGRSAFVKQEVLGTPYKFEKVGQSGMWMSELLPNLKTVADDVCH